MFNYFFKRFSLILCKTMQVKYFKYSIFTKINIIDLDNLCHITISQISKTQTSK